MKSEREGSRGHVVIGEGSAVEESGGTVSSLLEADVGRLETVVLDGRVDDGLKGGVGLGENRCIV
jgi:hypothetical protein